MNSRHSGVQVTSEIKAPADEAFALLTDWQGILRWWPEGAHVNMLEVSLANGSTSIPCTRIMNVENAPLSRETLLKADQKARRIYYMLEDGGIPIIRNYLATNVIDDIGGGMIRITFSSMFDMEEGADEAQAKAIVSSIYDIITRGFQGYFAARS